MSASVHPRLLLVPKQTLYAATRALGAPPLAVPLPNPNRLAPGTNRPAAVARVCVPCPFTSRAVLISPGVDVLPAATNPLLKSLAPISFLGQRQIINVRAVHINFLSSASFFNYVWAAMPAMDEIESEP